MYRNEGVNEEADDVFRLQHKPQRMKIIKSIRNRPEVEEAISKLIHKHIDTLHFDKIGSILSFISKSAYPLPDEDFRKMFKAVKRSLVVQLSLQ